MLEPRPKGYRNRKLTPDEVRAIRAAVIIERDIYRIAREYGVSRTTIYAVRRRAIYRDVK